MFKTFFSFFLTFFIVIGCSSHTPKPVNEPTWLYKPNLNGKTGAVGSSKPQFKGKTVQRRVAVARALDELAQQSGVDVENIIMRNEKSSAIGASSSTTVKSTQSASGVLIHAHIQEVWIDPRNKEMYVWLIEN